MTNKLEVRIHCELIQNNVRDAWLIQSCDYNFDKIKIDSDLQFITENYPCLKIQSFSDSYLVTKNESEIDINKSYSTLSSADFELFLGKILGFTCTNVDMKRSYELTYYKTTRTTDTCGFSVKFEPTHLISFICSCDEPQICEKEVEKLKNKILDVLNNSEYFKSYENDINISISEHITVEYLIDKLITNPTSLSKKEKFEATNYLYNLGFSHVFHDLFMNTVFQYDNPIHIGILIGLLSHYKDNVLEPFCPLQHSGKMEEVDKITEKWQDSLMCILTKTNKKLD
jgi:hypothetical protein